MIPALSHAYRWLAQWPAVGLDLAFPMPDLPGGAPATVPTPSCTYCGIPIPGSKEGLPLDTTSCHTCFARPPAFAWARAAYTFNGQVREAIHAFKYQEAFHALTWLSPWLADGYYRHAGEEAWDALVPVPLAPRRLRSRGFNQAAELAGDLGRSQRLPVWPCLRRCRDTVSQISLARSERWRNMKGAFELQPSFDVKGRTLLLIDDVFTTGATTHACAQALLEGGAARVCVLTVARGL